MTLAPATETRLAPGFADPVFDAQAGFRAALEAMAYPGRIHSLATQLQPPAPLETASAALALALFDFDTPVWLDDAMKPAADYLRFHCGAPLVDEAAQARFALIGNAASMPSLSAYEIGEDRYPDRSATLVISVPSLEGGLPTTWTGPGINGAISVAIAGLPDDFWSQWDDNHALYPQGVDVIFTSGASLVGLPRTIKVEI